MLVGISGHKNGLGKAFADQLPNVIGYDKLDSYNIKTDYTKIVESARDCDVFINNAYDGVGQILLHTELEKAWKHTDKLIINISSSTLSVYPTRNDQYAQVKRRLEKISRYARCRCECIRVPLMNTNLVIGKKHALTHKIDPNVVAKAIIEWHIS